MARIAALLLLFAGLLMAQLRDLSPKDLEALKKEGVVVIDIRTPAEWSQTGIIPGSKKIMFFDQFGRYDLNRFMSEFQKYVPNKESRFILVCRTGSRTKAVGEFLSEKLGYKNAMHLRGGIYAWIREHKPLQKQ